MLYYKYYLDQPSPEAVMVNGADVTSAVTRSDHGSCVASVGVVAYPTFRPFLVICKHTHKDKLLKYNLGWSLKAPRLHFSAELCVCVGGYSRGQHTSIFLSREICTVIRN